MPPLGIPVCSLQLWGLGLGPESHLKFPKQNPLDLRDGYFKAELLVSMQYVLRGIKLFYIIFRNSMPDTHCMYTIKTNEIMLLSERIFMLRIIQSI
jgi:hypothetical protein